MPSYLGDIKAMGLKVVSVFPRQSRHGVRFASGCGAGLRDASTGSFSRIMDSSSITAIRTGAVSGVATRLLAREDAHRSGDSRQRRAGEVASGGDASGTRNRPRARLESQSRTQRRTSPNASRGDTGTCSIEAMQTVEEAVDGADIICTTTAAPEPILKGEWIAAGTHINAVGSSVPFTRELDTAAVVTARKCSWIGANRRSTRRAISCFPKKEGVIGDDHILGEIGEILLGRVTGRESPDEITLFKSLGLAIEDLAAANYVYQKALASRRGRRRRIRRRTVDDD